MSALDAYDAGWREWIRLTHIATQARKRGALGVAAQATRKAERQSDANALLLETLIKWNHQRI